MQKNLETWCLLCFCNLMEKTEDCLYILKEVGLEVFVYSVVNSQDFRVVEAAARCLGWYEI